MKKIILIIIIGSLLLSGCGAAPKNNGYPIERIRQWQLREVFTKDIDTISGNPDDAIYVNDTVRNIILGAPKVEWELEVGTDKWLTFNEFVATGNKSDCEDLSIYYYLLLREAGTINDNDLVIRVLETDDPNWYHTVVVVYHNMGYLVIDNGILESPHPDYERVEAEATLTEIWR